MERIIKRIILFVFEIIRKQDYEKPYYDDIFECPIRNYQRCFEETDSRYLLKKYDDKYPDILYPIILRMSNKLIDDFGIEPSVEILYFKERDLLKAELEYIKTGNTSYLNDVQFIKMDIIRINSQLKISDDKNIKEINSRNHRILTQYLGYDSKKLSVFDYYVASRDCSNDHKKINGLDLRKNMRKIS